MTDKRERGGGETDRQTDRQAEAEAGSQTETERDRKRKRQTDTGTHRGTCMSGTIRVNMHLLFSP